MNYNYTFVLHLKSGGYYRSILKLLFELSQNIYLRNI